MKTIKKIGSESTNKNNSKVDINIQTINSIISKNLGTAEEKSDDYQKIVEEKFEQLRDDVMEIFTDEIFEALDVSDLLKIIDKEVSEEEIEDYIDNHYDDLRDKLLEITWDYMPIPLKIIEELAKNCLPAK